MKYRQKFIMRSTHVSFELWNRQFHLLQLPIPASRNCKFRRPVTVTRRTFLLATLPPLIGNLIQLSYSKCNVKFSVRSKYNAFGA